MSLLTPPKTSHREKENLSLVSSRGVVWAERNQYHNLSTSPKGPACKSAMMVGPVKSILKPTQPLLPLLEEEPREVTPEPLNPLYDSKYLESSVTRIISKDASLADLIAAYSILTARMRPNVTEDTDSACPLFDPLNNYREALCDCIARHLGRALEDPVVGEEDDMSLTAHLPSPMKSPKKKRGMTAEQAKYARDLCTLSQSVLKFLGLLFTLPIVCRTFTDKQLSEILTALLAIPLAKELPTPNARKTCALSICVLQTQRLPSAVLMPASSRIAHALCRGIDGELGKEGKKGSASDGLKAIHDLSLYQPRIFVPVFVIPLDSILNNLLAPTLALRVQACHALGGLVYGSISVPLSVAHTRMSSRVSAFLLTVTRPSPAKKDARAVPIVQESLICRTLRTTLNNADPDHVAQGPVWALSVIASFIVLLGSAIYTDPQVSRTISNLLSLTMRHKKSSVRALACIVWRSLVWAWFQPLLPLDPDADSETEESSSIKDRERAATRQAHWKLMQSVLTMGVGVSLVGAFVGNEADDNDLKRVTRILALMVRKNAETRADAMTLIPQLLGSSSTPMVSWDVDRLLPKSLFSANPGLLTADFKVLQNTVRAVFDDLPAMGEMRSLTQEELAKEGVIDSFFKLWKIAFPLCGELKDGADLLMEAWSALLKAVLSLAEDEGEEGEARVVKTAVDIILECLRASLKYDPTSEGSTQVANLQHSSSSFDSAQNLKFIHKLWVTARSMISRKHLEEYEEQLLLHLTKNEEEMTECRSQSRAEWSAFCADLVLACDEHGLRTFWEHHDVSDSSGWMWSSSTAIRSSVWATFVRAWQTDSRGTWSGMLYLLGLPFSGDNSWDMTDSDLGVWESFFEFTVSKAFDFGYDALIVVNHVVEVIAEKHNPTFTSCLRVADILMSNVEMENLLELPGTLIEFVTDTLRANYPPEPRNLQASFWMIRTLDKLIQACPTDLLLNLLDMLQEGLILWILDDYFVMTEDQYLLDVVTLYENLLVVIQRVPASQDTLERLSPLFDAAFHGRPKPPSVLEAFNDLWKSTSYSKMVPRSAWPAKVQKYVNDSLSKPSKDSGRGDPNSTGAATAMADTPSDCIPTSIIEDNTLIDAPVKSASLVMTPAPSSFPCPASSSLLAPPTILSTPPKDRLRTVSGTPPRPHKTPSFYPLCSPTTPSGSSKHSGSKTLSLFKTGSPSSPVNKRWRLENKENESPRPQLHHSPRSTKRRSSNGSDFNYERPAKKVRVEPPSMRRLAFAVIESAAPGESFGDADSSEGPAASINVFTPPKHSKKRKAMLLDAVEIPVIRRSDDNMSDKYVEEVKAGDQPLFANVLASQSVSASLVKGIQCSSPEIPDILELGSDDSMRQTSNSSPRTPTQLSSDDDLHVGQVTPHHLLSPALRRVYELEDPPSDDSTEPTSPSKDVLMRRLQRAGSVDLYQPTSLRHLLKS